MKILVNGIGNIGQTLINILSDYKSLLHISEIYALKNTSINPWNQTELDILIEKGVKVCTMNNPNYLDIENVINDIDYIFDCNANSFGLKNKKLYKSLINLKGCSAQGSENGFGIPFMTGINNEVIFKKKFVQIVSCNTHALSSIISTMAGNDLSNLIDNDFVIVRRSEDIGNHQRLVSANVLSRHLDNEIGTHHAIDVIDLFKTKIVSLNIQSSDITTPSQLMHTVRFNIKFRQMILPEELHRNIINNNSISRTSKFDSNVLFELGRRYSPYGRIFSHIIMNNNNILYDNNNNRIKGWAFIPQEGNTIISTIHAYLLQTGIQNDEDIIDKIKNGIIRKIW